MLLDRRALNRATLARQGLLRRWRATPLDAVERLVGLQAQTPQTWYTGLWSRVEGFDPDELSGLLARRAVVRMALMRSTIHLVSSADAKAIRPLVRPVIERGWRSTFGRRLDGAHVDAIVAAGRAFVDESPRTFRAIGDHLLTRWPDADRTAMEQAVRAHVPLVQVPPRGLWRRSGPVAHTSIEAWLGAAPQPAFTVDDLVRRYVGAFGPASVMDAQAWSGLTRLGEVFEQLRPELVGFRDERGRELFDLPDAPRPDPDVPAPPRFLYDYDNLLLGHADRSRVIDPDRVARIEVRENVSVSTFLLDGFVAGTWSIERAVGGATLRLRPLERLSPADEAGLVGEGRGLLALAADGAARQDVVVDPPWP